jgi:hypothetical protein
MTIDNWWSSPGRGMGRVVVLPVTALGVGWEELLVILALILLDALWRILRPASDHIGQKIVPGELDRQAEERRRKSKKPPTKPRNQRKG